MTIPDLMTEEVVDRRGRATFDGGSDQTFCLKTHPARRRRSGASDARMTISDLLTDGIVRRTSAGNESWGDGDGSRRGNSNAKKEMAYRIQGETANGAA